MKYEYIGAPQPEFKDREDAGIQLAEKLKKKRYPDPFVFALPRGGVPVAFEVAKRLDQAPLDVIVAVRLGMPGNDQVAFGAVAQGDIEVFDRCAIRDENISDDRIRTIITDGKYEMGRRIERFRSNTNMPNLTGRTAIIIDDGIATGLTMDASVKYTQTLNPLKIVVASPVCSVDARDHFTEMGMDVVCSAVAFGSMYVSQFYEKFDQITEQEVVDLLNRFKSEKGASTRQSNILKSALNTMMQRWLNR